MSKNLLGSTKAALAFAGLTIAVAVAVVGPQGGGGLLELARSSAMERQSSSPAEEKPLPASSTQDAAPAEPLDPASGWGGTPDPVFGEYSSEEVMPEGSVENPQIGKGLPGRAQRAGGAARGSGTIGGPVRADSPGTLVPRPDGAESEDAALLPE